MFMVFVVRGITCFWIKLSQDGALFDLPWLITRDFNVTCCNEERTGASNRQEKSEFNKFINDFNLLEFDKSGTRFTFSNMQNPPTRSRLDQFITNTNWLEAFLVHLEKVSNFYGLYHRVIILNSSISVKGGPKPCRF